MRHPQSAVLTGLRQAQELLDEHRAVLGPVDTSTRRRLDDAVADQTALSVTQTSGTHTSLRETVRRRALRARLRRTHMAPIAELATDAADDPNTVHVGQSNAAGVVNVSGTAVAKALTNGSLNSIAPTPRRTPPVRTSAGCP